MKLRVGDRVKVITGKDVGRESRGFSRDPQAQ